MSRDAIEEARAYYRGSGRCMEADIAALDTNPQGIVLCSPALLVLMRSCRSDNAAPWQQLAAREAGADTWYIHLLAGDLAVAARLAELLPPLPWLCFQRGCRSPRLRRYRFSSFLAALRSPSKQHQNDYGIHETENQHSGGGNASARGQRHC